jgi:ATP-dependent Clp protease ATP-binding subunit ClpB
MNYLIRGEDYLARSPTFKLVGRDQELKALSAILMRKSANSILLVGPGGVGCTALCKGLQSIKSEPNTPFDLVSKRLFWLDTDQLFASGDAEAINESFQRVMQLMDRTPDSIMIIEDARDFFEAARNSGSTHFVNAMCLAIKNNKVQVLLEARDDDLDLILKSHSDLHELFTLMDLEEPTGDALNKIVHFAAEQLNVFHQIKISDDAIKAAIELTSKYRSQDGGISRAQPERSVSLLDRALATYRLDAHSSPPPDGDKAKWETHQTELKRLYQRQRDGETAVMELEDQMAVQIAAEKARHDAGEKQEESVRGRIAKFARMATGGGLDSEEVGSLKQQIKKFQDEIAVNREAFNTLTKEVNERLELTRDVVLAEFSRISGISVSKLNEDERVKLRNLEADLKKRIFGQDHAVHLLANAVKTARVGRRNNEKPQAAFMFMGPSGVGKTEIAKALAQSLLDDEKALTRFDMSEYMEKHAVSRLIGAPPGYEGFEAGGILTNAMRRNPMRVLLFDEIEKAHPDVFNVFLQILSDGRLTDNVGRTVSFSESIIIMTTNLGQPHFLDKNMSFEDASLAAMEDVKKTYRSEFLNRFAGRQNLVCFNRLDLPSIEKIVRREFDAIDRTYAQDGIRIQFGDADLKAFCKAHYDPAVGARGLPGFIQANVEPQIVNRILDGGKKGDIKLSFNVKKGDFELADA